MFEAIKSWLDALELDVVRWRKRAAVLSIVAVLASWSAFVAIGPNWGIDFTGGTEIHLKFNESMAIGDVRTALRQLGLSDDAVQSVNGDGSNEFVIRIQDATFGMEELETDVRTALTEIYGADWIVGIDASAEVSARFVVDHAPPALVHQDVTRQLRERFPEARATPGKEDNQIVVEVPGLSERIKERIQSAVGDRSFDVLSTDAVGPKVGGELRRQGFISVFATLGLVLLYVAFRFDLGFAPGAVLALFHDVSLTLGVFVALGLELNLPIIGALLTIVGYSLNDTIVIYDRIRENRDKHRRGDMGALINTSISETLARTAATSVTTLLAMLLFLSFGGPVIRNFAFAMALGVVFGTYSTVFVASPMILVMEKIKPGLSRLVAQVPDISDDDEESDEGEPLTETEKRRRVRAEPDRREPLA